MECALNGKPQSAEQAGSEPAESAAEKQGQRKVCVAWASPFGWIGFAGCAVFYG